MYRKTRSALKHAGEDRANRAAFTKPLRPPASPTRDVRRPAASPTRDLRQSGRVGSVGKAASLKEAASSPTRACRRRSATEASSSPSPSYARSVDEAASSPSRLRKKPSAVGAQSSPTRSRRPPSVMQAALSDTSASALDACEHVSPGEIECTYGSWREDTLTDRDGISGVPSNVPSNVPKKDGPAERLSDRQKKARQPVLARIFSSDHADGERRGYDGSEGGIGKVVMGGIVRCLQIGPGCRHAPEMIVKKKVATQVRQLWKLGEDLEREATSMSALTPEICDRTASFSQLSPPEMCDRAASVFHNHLASMPTANADGPGPSEGTQRRLPSRPFRCHPRIRRSPRAFAIGMLRKKKIRAQA